MAAKKKSALPIDVEGNLLKAGDRVQGTRDYAERRPFGNVMGVKGKCVTVKCDDEPHAWQSAARLWRKA